MYRKTECDGVRVGRRAVMAVLGLVSRHLTSNSGSSSSGPVLQHGLI